MMKKEIEKPYATLCSWLGIPEPEEYLELTPLYKTDPLVRFMRKCRTPLQAFFERAQQHFYDSSAPRKELNKIKLKKKLNGTNGYAYNMDIRIRTGLLGYMNSVGMKKDKKTWEYLTFTWKEFKDHFEMKFEEYNSMINQWHPETGEKYSWDNRDKWDIEHWKPKSWFFKKITESTSKEEQERILIEEVWALDNLHPMWSNWNSIKSARYEGLFIPGKRN